MIRMNKNGIAIVLNRNFEVVGDIAIYHGINPNNQ